MILPSLLSSSLKRVDFFVTIIVWLIGFSFICISIYIGNSYNSLWFLLASSFYMIFISYESYCSRIEIETKSKHEIHLLKQKAETEREKSEIATNELRHIIANVAHDLKTVCKN